MCIHAIHKPGSCQITIHDERGCYIGCVQCPKDTLSVSVSGTCVFASTRDFTYVYECASGHPYQASMFHN